MTEQTAVIVPVMRRPQNAAPFVESLRASTDHAVVYAIADAGDIDTINAWLAVGAVVTVFASTEQLPPEDGDQWVRRVRADRPGTFAEKVNLGYGCTTEPWLFITGDDVRFRRPWLAHAQAMAYARRADVVGTNDLGNELTMSGEHGTHLLIRRSYVDEVGASWDGPGVVCHEGYRHWYVDDEIVSAAKQRKAWAHAALAVVEHLHPRWGKASDDEVYRLGQSFADQDGRLFRRRAVEHAR